MYNHGKEKRNTIHFQIIIFLCVPTHIHTLSVVSFHLVVPVMLGRWGNPEMFPYFFSLPLDYKFNLLQCSHCPVGLDSIFPGMPASVCHINLLYCVNRIQVPVGSVYWLGPGQYLCATYYYSLGAARALTFVLWHWISEYSSDMPHYCSFLFYFLLFFSFSVFLLTFTLSSLLLCLNPRR